MQPPLKTISQHESLVGESPRSPLAITARSVTLSVVIVQLLPSLCRPDMFMDGTIYAAVSRNLALGFGDIWHPAFSPTNGAAFYEHPPLAFLLESYAFRAFGDHFWVEKLYSALTAVATIAVVIAVWRQLTGRQSSLAENGWLPILLWAMFKHWSWQYGNNYLENTVGVFATLAVYAVLRANENQRVLSGWIVLAAVCTLGAVLSKGPVGLFPLITPVVAGATVHRKNWKRRLLGQFRIAGFILRHVWPGAATR